MKMKTLLSLINRADLVVHPGAGNPDGIGTECVCFDYYPTPIADVPRAGIVHRLDKDTHWPDGLWQNRSGSDAFSRIFATA